MESFGYESCKANMDLWLKLEIRPKNGVQYYSYLLCYVNDILFIHDNAQAVLQWLHKYLTLKSGLGKTYVDLNAKLHKTGLNNGVWA